MKKYIEDAHINHFIDFYGDDNAAKEKVTNLCSDPRLIGAFEWLIQNRPTKKGVYLESGRVQKGIVELIPGGFLECAIFSVPNKSKFLDMNPADRKDYLTKVRNTAKKLAYMLEGTMFDDFFYENNDKGLSVDEASSDFIDEKTIRSLTNEFIDDEVYTIAYDLKKDGKLYRHNFDYPLSSVNKLLEEVVQWAEKDDYHDFFSTRSITHSGTAAKKTLFIESLFRYINEFKPKIPYQLYADAANVLLDLPEEDYISKEAVRKKINQITKNKQKSYIS